MKVKNKILAFIVMLIVSSLGYIVYASWQAGNGVKWIADPDSTTRFEDHSSNTSDYRTGYYLSTYYMYPGLESVFHFVIGYLVIWGFLKPQFLRFFCFLLVMRM